jgi:hypothetical protein
MKVFASYWLCLIVFLVINQVNAQVSININDERFNYPGDTRLADVLAPVALQKHWYWPGSALFKLNSTDPQQLRSQIFQRMATLQALWHGEQSKLEALSNLRQQLDSWQLAKRIDIKIDYDLARTNAEFNPQFDAGEYLLLLKLRPTDIRIFGLIATENKLKHRDAIDVSRYLDKLSLLPGADKSTVYIIQSDGRVFEAPIAYWNRQHQELMPGSQVFVPFDDSWSSDLAQLNKLIVQLAADRVYL